MDSTWRLTQIRNQKGFAIVYIALIMVAICAFIGLAVDIGYLYVAKGQLQNASDAAALAGASKLTGGGTAQTLARTEAITFASSNSAATQNVRISSDGANNLSDNNDITVGNWNRSLSPPYLESRAPVNAVKVQARRTAQSLDGAVNLFFSSVIGWSQMPVAAEAIAARTPKAGFFFMIGNNVCNSTIFPVVLSPGPAVNNMAWTSLRQVSTNANDVKDLYICPGDKLPDEEVCGYNVYTTGGVTDVFQGVETDFYDLNYDAVNKTFGLDKKGSRVVSTWTVIVPVSTANDPSNQPTPQPVWGYARIRIIRACGNGVGNACNATGRLFTAPQGVCSGGEDDIVIDQITCVSCANSTDMVGVRPNLVQ